MAEQEKQDASENSFESIISFADIPDEPEQRGIENDINELSFETATMLALITHIGRFVSDGMCKLATSESERYKDIIKVAEITLTECESFISFDALASNFTISVRNYFTSSKRSLHIDKNYKYLFGSALPRKT